MQNRSQHQNKLSLNHDSVFLAQWYHTLNIRRKKLSVEPAKKVTVAAKYVHDLQFTRHSDHTGVFARWAQSASPKGLNPYKRRLKNSENRFARCKENTSTNARNINLKNIVIQFELGVVSCAEALGDHSCARRRVGSEVM